MPNSKSSGLKAVLLSVSISLIAVPAYATRYYVAPAGQSSPAFPYSTAATAASSIQTAVNAATDGDEVMLLPGTYTPPTQIEILFKGVTVRSRDGRSTTVVDMQGKSRAFYMNSIIARVEGLWIRNGVAPVNPLHGDSYGGGVYIEDGGTVSDCIIDTCSATYGGGVRIRLQGAVENSLLRWNYASVSGGGIQTAYGGSVSGSTLSYNTAAQKGGGIYCFDGGEMTGCQINGNQAWFGGGARLYYETYARPKMSRCRVYNNKTIRLGTQRGAGGGIQIELGGTAENCLIYDNESEYYGGGVEIYGAGTVQNCTIANNRTTDTTGDGVGDGLGGGLYTVNGGTLQNSIIFDNTTASSPNRNLDDTAVVYRNCLTFPSVIGNGNISGLPKYTDGAARNYTLLPTSPCIDAGYSTGAPTVDFIGTQRPLIGKTNGTVRVYDIGAYEYYEVDDIDRDGMPTWWELRYGLNPDSAADATLGALTNSFDGDGLDNLHEYLAGTSPLNRDTDGDGLIDGDEVYAQGANRGYYTSPVLVDTDGDGFADRHEILNDSDPSDVLSFLATVSGTLSYSGTLQNAGPVRLSVANVLMTSRTAVVAGLGSYSVTNVPTKRPLTITAYRDGNTNLTQNTWEPTGAYAGNPLTLAGSQSGVNIVLNDSTNDVDHDGLADYEELFQYGTIYTNADTDVDGMPDGWEVHNGLNPRSNTDAVGDPDADGLSNLQEFLRGTNPNNADTDGDGMPDGWEVQFPAALNPLVADGTGDYEGDGLTNLREYQLGTSPINQDSDGDGMRDGWEALYMPALNPLVDDAADDPDFDDLDNLGESTFGTDPTVADTDGDNMPDGWEAQYPLKLNPLANDAASDWDGDGLVNFDEYLRGTDPTNPDTDGDGSSDGDEVAAGTDPLNSSSYTVAISGLLIYSGSQTGVFRVAASQVPTGSVFRTSTTNAGMYVIGNAVNSTNYSVRAFLDSNGNATQDTWEARGTWNDTNGVPMVIWLTNDISGVNITLVDPATDSDLDSLSDYDEVYVYGTDPMNPDTDGDLMPDGWEVLYQNACDPLNTNDWNQDYDVDGLRNQDEFFNGTNPEVADTDGDGLNDGQEVFTTLTNPTDADSDDDGLNDYQEFITYGTNPLNPDSDGDGFNDGPEIQLGTDPLNPLSFPATVSGTLTYAGSNTGTVYVTAVDGATNLYTATLASPGAYSLTNLPTLKTYVIRAYIDSNGNLTQDSWEAQAVYTGSPLLLTNNLANANMTLVHPLTDSDADGLTDYDEVNVYGTDPNNPDTDNDLMPDAWEVAYSPTLNPLSDDAVADPDSDGLTNLQEYGLGTNPTSADTDSDGMPDGWEASFIPSLNPLADDASGDPDADGLTNLQEYGLGTNPTLADTDGDGFTDSVEVSIGSDPLDNTSYPFVISGMITYGGSQTGMVYLLASSVGGTVSNAMTMTGTSVVYSVSNLIAGIDYNITAYRDSTGDGLQDPWEATGAYAGNPILQPTQTLVNVNIMLTDPLTDSDSDGLTDYAEVYVHGTNPMNPDTDGDGMPDGWEVLHSLLPLANDATGDPDLDLLQNLGEFQAGTDPNDSDSDNDLMPDGWEATYRPTLDPTTDDAAADPDNDGLTNLQEYGLGTDPTLADTDSDGMPDGWEASYSPTLDPLTDDAAGDPDSDTLSNLEEYQEGTDPTDPDTDNDGHNDGFERLWRSNPLDPLSFPVTLSGTILNVTAAPQTGTVYVVLNLESNANWFASLNIGSVTNVGNPFTTTQYVPTLSNYWVTAFMDLSGNGLQDTWEPYGAAFNGTNSITPTTNFTVGLIPLVDSLLESDGDGLTDYDEVVIYGTDPTLDDTDADGFNDFVEIWVYGTDPLSAASFPASIGGAISYAGTQSGPLVIVADDGANVYSNSFGNYAAGTYSSATNLPTLTNYAVIVYIDSNTNGVPDLWEAQGVPAGSPFLLTANVTTADVVLVDPSADTDGDGLTDAEEHFVYFTDPLLWDTDGDGMPDGWEVQYSLNPLLNDAAGDPDSDGLTNFAEYITGTDPNNADTDGDDLSDGDEVNIYATDPLNPDTEGDGMPDGWEVLYLPALNPLIVDAADDPDGDGLTNLQEYGLGTDPTNPDTDGDGLTDYEEAMDYGTDPTLSDTDADGFTDYEELLEIGSDALNMLDPVVVDDDAAADPVPNDPNNTNYSDENGSLAFPYDSIQEAVNAAQSGFTVLVLDGIYKSTGNGDINPIGKDITIRSRNGYAFTEILQDSGNGFIMTSGETAQTIIQGFTIRTSVADLGSAGILVTGSSPVIRECRFFDCGESGIYVSSGGQPLIQDCLFENNQGAIKVEESHPRIERCIMRFNEDEFGGGIWITGTSTVTSQPVIVNCLIVTNRATSTGGGVYAGAYTRPIIVNTTIADNSAVVRGGGIYNAGDMKFWNGILWGNTAPVGPGFSLDKAFETSYSCMQTARPTSIQVITANPKFAGGGDYSLLSSSPCIDHGTGSIPYPGAGVPTNDLSRDIRPVYVSKSPGYDVGAYEYQPGGALFVQSPGGTAGLTIEAGLPQNVTWTYDGTVGTNLALEYTYQFLTDPALAWTPASSNVDLGTGGSGSTVWMVPVTNTSRCYVRVSDTTNSQVSGISSFAVSITNGIQVYSPAASKTYYLGQTVNVAWASSPATNTTVQWVFSTNGVPLDAVTGEVLTNVAHVAGGATNTGEWALDLRDTAHLATNMALYVSSGGLRSGVAAGGLSIMGLVVTIPAPGAVVQTGATYTVRWTGLGAGPAVNIQYSSNGGGSFVTVSNGVANVNGTNAFVWTVPVTVTSNAVLQVASVSNTNIAGRTTFAIADVGGASVNLAGDGIPDLWKLAQGLDPENLDGVSGAGDDPDGDGASNYQEWLAGTAPLSAASYFGIVSIDPATAGTGLAPDAGEAPCCVLRWFTVPGRRYFVEVATAPGGPWVNVSGLLDASGSELIWTDTQPAIEQRFYRIGSRVE